MDSFRRHSAFASYQDEIDSASGEVEERSCRLLSNIVHCYDENEDIKCGVKLQKYSHQWSVANNLFKAECSNKPVSSTGLNDTIKELSLVIYNCFKCTCVSVDSIHNREVSVKYKENNANDLLRILKTLKRSDGDSEEIKFVSRKLRNVLKYGNNGDRLITTSTNFDHDKLIGNSFWACVKRFLKPKDSQLPLLTKDQCISYFIIHLHLRFLPSVFGFHHGLLSLILHKFLSI